MIEVIHTFEESGNYFAIFTITDEDEFSDYIYSDEIHVLYSDPDGDQLSGELEEEIEEVAELIINCKRLVVFTGAAKQIGALMPVHRYLTYEVQCCQHPDCPVHGHEADVCSLFACRLMYLCRRHVFIRQTESAHDSATLWSQFVTSGPQFLECPVL